MISCNQELQPHEQRSDLAHKHGVQRDWLAGTNAMLAGEVDRGISSLESEVS
jgi:hypothetical protein